MVSSNITVLTIVEWCCFPDSIATGACRTRKPKNKSETKIRLWRDRDLKLLAERQT